MAEPLTPDPIYEAIERIVESELTGVSEWRMGLTRRLADAARAAAPSAEPAGISADEWQRADRAIEAMSAPDPVGLREAARNLLTHVGVGSIRRCINPLCDQLASQPHKPDCGVGQLLALLASDEPVGLDVAPLDEGMLRWIVAKSGIEEPNPPICDWACAQCTIGKLDPPTVDGFRCVPHEAAARLAATEEQGQGNTGGTK